MMTFVMRLEVKVLAVAFGLGISAATVAAPVTMTGDTVKFSFDSNLLGLFGMPKLIGDTLFFTPTSFVSQSGSGAPPLHLQSSTMNISVAPRDPALWVGTVNLTEVGDYLLFDPIPPVSTNMGVAVTGQIRVRDLATLTETTASILPTTPMDIVGLPSRNWTATAFADVGQWNAKSANVTVENILLSWTLDAPSMAFIEKKGVLLQVSAVPEPESYALMLAGLGLLGFIARRRMAVRS